MLDVENSAQAVGIDLPSCCADTVGPVSVLCLCQGTVTVLTMEVVWKMTKPVHVKYLKQGGHQTNTGEV